MIKTLSMGRMDNFKTFFKNGNSCANALFSRWNAKTESNYILNTSTNFVDTDIECPVLNIDFVLGGFINWYFINRLA